MSFASSSGADAPVVVFEYTTDVNDRMQCVECAKPIASEGGTINMRFTKVGASGKVRMQLVHTDTCIQRREQDDATYNLYHLVVAPRHARSVLPRDVIEVARLRCEVQHPQLFQYVKSLKGVVAASHVEACWLRSAPLALPSFRLFLPRNANIAKTAFDRERFNALFSQVTVFTVTARQLDAKHPFAASTVKQALINNLKALGPKNIKLAADACIVFLAHTESSFEAHVVVYSHLSKKVLDEFCPTFLDDNIILFHELARNATSRLAPSWTKTQNSIRNAQQKDTREIAEAMAFSTEAFDVRCDMVGTPLDVLRVEATHDNIVMSCNAQSVFPSTRFYIWDTARSIALGFTTHEAAKQLPITLSTLEALPEEVKAAQLTQLDKASGTQHIWSYSNEE
jgi:hypothetical protein